MDGCLTHHRRADGDDDAENKSCGSTNKQKDHVLKGGHGGWMNGSEWMDGTIKKKIENIG